jgi:hypothetical protein
VEAGVALTAVLRPAATFLVIVAWAMPDGPVGAQTVSVCSSQLRNAGGIEVDLAPPGTYVDLCREDLELCRTLTAGYPPSVTTLAYFVPADDWATFQKTRQGFREYLIAQLGSERVDELPRLKEYVRAQSGNIPDHTQLPRIFADRGRVSLGIVEESPDSISMGVLLKVQLGATLMNLASINSALAINGRILSLYSFQEVTGLDQLEPVKATANRWLTCLRQRNRPK